MSQLLQTSPYLTVQYPEQPSSVVYVTDINTTEYPTGDPVSGSQFGIVGLDRETHWRHDRRELELLQAAAAEPVALSQLREQFGLTLVDKLVDLNWLQAPADLCSEYVLRTGQIEVTAHCNWGCAFCPVSSDPKPKETMSLELFEEIVSKLSVHPQVRYVTFHFYNEPLLDKFFAQRLQILKRYNMKLALFTNGSALTSKKIDEIHQSDALHALVFNLPTLDKVKFGKLTKSKNFELVLANIDKAINAGLSPIQIAVNEGPCEVLSDAEKLREEYEKRGVEVRATIVSDRAGEVGAEYAQNVAVSGRLTGCSWPVNHAYFSVRGDLFMCCNDYYQREVFGNVADGDLHTIMASDRARKLRRKVFGVSMAPSDFLCRSCHDQLPDFPHRQFLPMATFPNGRTSSR